MVDIVVDLNNLMGELLKAGGTDVLDRMTSNGDRIVFTQALLDEFRDGGGDRFFEFQNWRNANPTKVNLIRQELTIDDYRRYADALDGGAQGKVRNAIKAFDGALDEAVE